MSSELWIGIGVAPLDAFYKGLTGQVGYVFHFSDSFAWQVGRRLLSYNIKTGLRNQLETQFGVSPTAFPQLKSIVGSDAMWTPIYGKTSWLNSSGGPLRGVRHPRRLGGERAHLRRTWPAAPSTVPPRRSTSASGRGVFTTKSVSFRLDFSNEVRHLQGARERTLILVQFALALNFGGTE